MALGECGAEGEDKGAHLGWICGLAQDSQLIRFPGMPRRFQSNLLWQTGAAQPCCSQGFLSCAKGDSTLWRNEEQIHSQAWSDVQGFSELGVITPLITASQPQPLLSWNGIPLLPLGKGCSRAQHPK